MSAYEGKKKSFIFTLKNQFVIQALFGCAKIFAKISCQKLNSCDTSLIVQSMTGLSLPEAWSADKHNN